MKVTRMDASASSERGNRAVYQKNITGQESAVIFKVEFPGSGILNKLSKLKTDDYILIGMIAVLFFEGCDDYILLAALGYLLIMGFWL